MVEQEGIKKSTLARQVAEEIMDISAESKKKKDKDFKLSFIQRSGARKKAKQNKALTFLIKTTGGFDLKWRQIKDDQIYVKEIDNFYSVGTESVGYYKSYPVVLITEWDLKALSRDTLKKEAEDGRYANPQRIIIHNIEKAVGQMKMKSGFGGKSAIWIILIVGVVVYMLYKALLGQ